MAYADGFGRVLKISLVFVFGHFIGSSLVVSNRVLSGGKAIGTRSKGITGEEETTGTFCATGGGRTIGVWVLF